MWKGQRACDRICIGELEQTRYLFAWHSTRVTEMRVFSCCTIRVSKDWSWTSCRSVPVHGNPKVRLRRDNQFAQWLYRLHNKITYNSLQSSHQPCHIAFKIIAICTRFKKAALRCTRKFVETVNARDEPTCDKYCTSMVDECVAMPEVQDSTIVRRRWGRGRKTRWSTLVGRHLGLIFDLAE